jgi:predicted PurR-regulated permease PerM
VPGRAPGDSDRRPAWVALAQSKRVVWVLVAACLILLIGVWAFQAVGSFLFLLMLAWLLSIAMEPMVGWLIRRGMSRSLSSAAVLFGLIAITVGIAAMFGQVFISQAQELKDAFPEAVRQAVAWVNTTFDTSFNTDQIYSALQVSPEKVAELAQRFGGGLLGVFGAVVTFIFNLVTILVFAYYLSADSIKLRRTIGSYLPPRYQPMLMTIWTIAVDKTGGYVVSKVILATFSSVAYATFFLIIDVPFWLPLGVLMGISGQFVPIIGTYIGVIVPALFSVLRDPLDALWIVVFATVYQQFESYWLTPKISNRTMDVHPAVALGSVFVGVALMGPIGAVIGIPVAAAALTVADTFRRRHELLPELETLQDDDGESNGGSTPVGPAGAPGPA